MIDDPPRVTGTNSGRLIFDRVQQSDTGYYTCTYDDGGGKAIFTTPLFFLRVVPAEGELPAASLLGLALLVAAVAGVASIRRQC